MKNPYGKPLLYKIIENIIKTIDRVQYHYPVWVENDSPKRYVINKNLSAPGMLYFPMKYWSERTENPLKTTSLLPLLLASEADGKILF